MTRTSVVVFGTLFIGLGLAAPGDQALIEVVRR